MPSLVFCPGVVNPQTAEVHLGVLADTLVAALLTVFVLLAILHDPRTLRECNNSTRAGG